MSLQQFPKCEYIYIYLYLQIAKEFFMLEKDLRQTDLKEKCIEVLSSLEKMWGNDVEEASVLSLLEIYAIKLAMCSSQG